MATSASAATSTAIQTCGWPGHCLGDACSTYNDCDHNWICTDGVCCTLDGVCADPSSSGSTVASTSASISTATKAATATRASSIGSGTITVASTSVASVSSSAILTASTTAAASTSQAQPTPSTDGGLPTSAAIGIGVAIPCAIAVIAGVAIWVWRKRRNGGKQRLRGAATESAERMFGQKAELDADVLQHPTKSNGVVELSAALTPRELASHELPVEAGSVELSELDGTAIAWVSRQQRFSFANATEEMDVAPVDRQRR
ncbi:hypothetical protein K490DRAFT_54089 [Saccharata proteae CBS 121410]|uniref:Uncharacterized protein n=1 Tax=Saccharata proteae CBS 121410 TaxID=1314787 RepID=A0A9P4I182_9PEZI|nr:hypothetical protein K490DRAFT_54089 [Saccharata proteae CBS 121410]